jgi:hypothetical protein
MRAKIQSLESKLANVSRQIKSEEDAHANNNNAQEHSGFKYYKKEVDIDITTRTDRDINDLTTKREVYNNKRLMAIAKLQAEIDANDEATKNKIETIRSDATNLRLSYVNKMDEIVSKLGTPTSLTYRKNVEQQLLLSKEIAEARAVLYTKEEEEENRKNRARREEANAVNRALAQKEALQHQKDLQAYLEKKAITDKAEQERLDRNAYANTIITPATIKMPFTDQVICMLTKVEMDQIDRNTIPADLLEQWDEQWDEFSRPPEE